MSGGLMSELEVIYDHCLDPIPTPVRGRLLCEPVGSSVQGWLYATGTVMEILDPN